MLQTLEAPLAPDSPAHPCFYFSFSPENDLNGFPATCSEGKRFAQEAWLRVATEGSVPSRKKLKVVEAPTNNQQRMGEAHGMAFYSRQCSRDSLRSFRG